MKFRSDIEGLRGIAVLFVVLFHAHISWMSGGFIGVDVFFVLSGYLISGILISEFRSAGNISFLRFYARRSARLVPAAVLVIVATLVVALLYLAPPEILRVARTAIRALLYTSNISFARNISYFDAVAGDDVLLHTWSLGVEEQFYLFWPLFIAGLGALAIARRPKRLAAVFVAVAISSFIVSFAWSATRPAWAFFLTPTRAWEFACGALVYVFGQDAPPIPRRVGQMLGAVGMVVLVGTAVFLTERVTYPGSAALLPVGASAAILAAGVKTPDGFASRILSLPFMRWLGKLSYGWYLWHWPVLALGALVFGLTGNGTRLLLCLLALLLSFISYYLVETPLRVRGAASPHRGRVVVMCLTLSIVAAGSGWLAVRRANAAMSTPRQLRLAAARVDKSDGTVGCMLDYGQRVTPACVFGDTAGAKRVLLMGDSKAAQWLPAVDSIGKRRGWRVRVFSKGACPVETLRPFYLAAIRKVYRSCVEWRASALDSAIAGRPDLILIASSKNYTVGENAFVTLDEWRDGTELTLRRLRASGAPVVIIRDTPSFSTNVPDCLGRPGSEAENDQRCSATRARATPTEPFAQTRAAVAAVGGSYVLDMSDVLCEPVLCHPIVDGIIAYRDADHLSRTMAYHLAASLEGRIDAALAASRATLPAPTVR